MIHKSGAARGAGRGRAHHQQQQQQQQAQQTSDNATPQPQADKPKKPAGASPKGTTRKDHKNAQQSTTSPANASASATAAEPPKSAPAQPKPEKFVAKVCSSFLRDSQFLFRKPQWTGPYAERLKLCSSTKQYLHNLQANITKQHTPAPPAAGETAPAPTDGDATATEAPVRTN